MSGNATPEGREGNAPGGGASPFLAPQISLPKGGGAIRGIDEKFTANPVTGTGSLSVPLAVSPGRSGFGPQLSLSYDSGSGNGIFGVGWSLSLPSITRRTDKGLPRYCDDEESDIFVLSGSEDLVPVLLCDENGRTRFDEFERDGYRVKRYRPRIEGLFARIERWTCLGTGEAHWRTLSKNNILTVYGLDCGSRIADPEAPHRVFSWLICRSYDDTGNAIIYNYVAENDAGVALKRTDERNRIRTANRYPKRIRYGNRIPLLLDSERPSFRRSHLEPHDLEAVRFMFEVVFDYGEGHYRDAKPDEESGVLSHASIEANYDWPVRRDPFSSYRSGFEIRTYRLCRRVLMFHHFPEELGTESCLVRSTEFRYCEKPVGSFLDRVVQSGHKRREGGCYLTRSLPPLDLFYTASPLEDPHFKDYRLDEVDPESLANLPTGIDGDGYRLVDLDGEGISGVLSEQDQAWFYKPNLGGGGLGAVETVRNEPSLAALSGGHQQFMDIAGDGNLDLVDLSPPVQGFYERALDAGWAGFRAFRSLPVRDWSDPNLRFVDLTGDGIADVLITEGDAFAWHPSLLREGFGTGIRVPVPLEEEKGPRIVFADGTQSIYLGDMSGDGLSDIVRIRNGEVCYWPNQGYGRFGAKVTMDHSPWFDEPDLFDQKRIRLADTDGSGTTDIVYLGSDGVKIYLNETGNGWSDARHLRQFPAVDNVSAITVADFLGRGTACLVWSSPLPAESGRQLRFVDLMCGQKPHLLNRSVNNLGAETRIDYASSTKFYLADKAAGTPWVTRLPFPVHVVERVETYDYVSRNRFVTRYTYHHGFYDGVEREFRGFGRVDQLDTETFAALTASGNFPAGDNIDAASSVPPVLTKTWYHTGVYLEGGRISRHLAHEYYREGTAQREVRLSHAQTRAMLLDDTILPERVTPEEGREACRSLKGSMLRQEIYALDENEESSRPYSVTENNFTIRMLQKRRTNRHAVFFTHPREQVSFHYERKLYDVDGRRHADPRVSHGVTLRVDDYGNALKAVAIGYGRRFPDPSPLLTNEDRERQLSILLTLTESDYTNAVEEPDAYRTPVVSEQRLFELINLMPETALPGITNFFRFRELADKVAQAGDGCHDLPFEDWQAVGAVEEAPYRRLLKKSRTLYRDNHLRNLLPLGRLEALALPGQSYQLALTRDLLTDVYRRGEPTENLLPDRETVLRDEGGYADLDGDGNWWVPSGRIFYSPGEGDSAAHELAYVLRHFFLPRRYRDVFGNVTKVAYDGHDLAPIETTDPVGNITRAELDFRVLSPRLLTDPNGNRSQVVFDARGLVAGAAVMGKVGENLGDSLDGFEPDLARSQLGAFLADPRGNALSLLGNATTRIIYDVERYFTSEKPAFAATIARETHVSDLGPGENSKTQVSLIYSDGFGREIQKKLQAEPGPLVRGGRRVDPRWIGSGWTIFNNKGKPVRQYEPFFSASHDFEVAAITGVSPIFFYDPVERVVAALHPNNTYEKVVFDPWRQTAWDVNDTVTLDPRIDPDVGAFFRRLPDSDYLPTWYRQRIDGAKGQAEKAAAEKAARHTGTPTTAYFDSVGRTFLTIADNGKDEVGRDQRYPTRGVLDIEGNQRAVTDALDRIVMRYDFDLLGTPLYQASMEAGERWILSDAFGKPIRAWNSRLYAFRTEYDALRRPIRSFVRGGDPYERNAKLYPCEILFERTVYGDSADSGLTEHRQRESNLRGKPYRQFDSAGVVTSDRYDFKGNLLHSARQFAQDYTNMPDWSRDPAIENESFSGHTIYDALNRAVTVTCPDRSVHRPKYNEANLLEKIDIALRGAHRDGQRVWTSFVSNIDYNAKRQRTRIDYVNGAATTYDYDEKTFRLLHLRTVRSPRHSGFASQIFGDAAIIQDLHYTYDPAGNITQIADASLRTVFHDNQKVDPVCRYTYDPLYRLIEATGRENVAQSAFQFAPPEGNYRDYPYVGGAQLRDLQALRNFAERYEYDPVGNFLRLIHRAECGNWSHHYTYNEKSLIEPARKSNRLSRTHLKAEGNPVLEPYLYDAHGNIIQMPHLPLMQWDFMDRLASVSPQSMNCGKRETTFYVYDATGQRVRKITERQNGTRKNERVYLGGVEIYREYGSSGAPALERETLHVMLEKQRIALVETQTSARGAAISSPSPVQRYQLCSHVRSEILELDEGGSLISYEEYSPYGETSFQAAHSAAEVSLKRYRYTGKERDEENGFYYHGARYYAPWLGRWIACDPIGVSDGINVFLYARNNPIAFSDTTGLKTDAVDNTGGSGSDASKKGSDKAAASPWTVLGTTVAAVGGLGAMYGSFLGPIGAVIGGVAGAIGGALLSGQAGLLAGAASTVWNAAKNVVSAVGTWLAGAASSVWKATTSAIAAAWDWTTNKVSAAWSWTKGAASTAWDWIKGAASSAWNWTKGAASSAWNWTKGAASSAWNWTKGAASSAWNWTKGAASSAWNWTKSAAARVGSAVAQGAKIGLDVLGKIWTLPNTLLGLTLGFLTLPFGGNISIEHNAIVFNNFPIGSRAFTLGNTIFNPDPSLNSPNSGYTPGATMQTGAHEEAHTYQYEVLGPLFLPVYFISWLFLGDQAKIPFENAADRYGRTGKDWL
jgi:RHS repeat-associated protein